MPYILLERYSIDKFLRLVSIILLDSQLARIAAAIRREYHLKTPDSVIAATALFTGSTLVTRNVRDFNRVPELKLLEI